jgi:hypothetical protein
MPRQSLLVVDDEASIPRQRKPVACYISNVATTAASDHFIACSRAGVPVLLAPVPQTVGESRP